MQHFIRVFTVYQSTCTSLQIFTGNNRIKRVNYFSDLGYDRYKFIVQVAIGEQRGQGVK